MEQNCSTLLWLLLWQIGRTNKYFLLRCQKSHIQFWSTFVTPNTSFTLRKDLDLLIKDRGKHRWTLPLVEVSYYLPARTCLQVKGMHLLLILIILFINSQVLRWLLVFAPYTSKCFIKEIITNRGTQTSLFGLWHGKSVTVHL